MKLDCCLSPHAKINSQWIKDLNIGLETIKSIEENIGTKLLDLGLKEDFMNFDLKGKGSKGKNKRMRLHQTKKLLHSKRNHQQGKETTIQMEKYICKQHL